MRVTWRTEYSLAERGRGYTTKVADSRGREFREADTTTVSSQLIDYADFHRTVVAYHVTDVTAAERLVGGDDFGPSDRADEWFGNGVYFWEYAFRQAWWQARDYEQHREPAVVGALVRLRNCFDLVDPGNVPVNRRH